MDRISLSIFFILFKFQKKFQVDEASAASVVAVGQQRQSNFFLFGEKFTEV